MTDTSFIFLTKCSLQAHFFPPFCTTDSRGIQRTFTYGGKNIQQPLATWIQHYFYSVSFFFFLNVNQRVVLYSECIHALKINIMQRYLHPAAGGLFMASMLHSNPQTETVRVETIHWNNQQCDGRLSPVHYRSMFLSASARRAKSFEKAARRSGGGNSPGWQRLRGGNRLSCVTWLHAPHSPLCNQAPLPTSNLVWRVPLPTPPHP